MEEKNREYPVAYGPISKGIIKEEPKDDREEFGEQSEQLLAYPPLPHGVIKKEPQLEDGIQEETAVLGYIKEEPTFEEEDGDECNLVGYAPLPHGYIKEELGVEDGHDEFSFGEQQELQQEGKENQINEAIDGASIIVPFVDTPALGNETDRGEPRTKKRQRSSETTFSSSRSKRSSAPKNADGVNQWEAEEFAMEECDAGAKKQQNSDQYDERSEHSSLDGVMSTDEEDLVPNQALAAEQAQRRKKSVRKLSVQAIHSQEKGKLLFKCKNCDRAFTTEQYFKKHLATSCGIEPQFTCKECGNQFTRKDSLQKHLMKIHNVERSQLAAFGAGPNIRPTLPFKCEKCSRSYKQKKGLTQHLKYECKLDPSFSCALCNYRATLKHYLRRHLMTVHSVDRSQFAAFGTAAPMIRPVQPFKCEKCENTYKQKKNLTRHWKYQCGVDPSFFCTQCDFRASLKGNLKQHLIYVHAGAGLCQL